MPTSTLSAASIISFASWINTSFYILRSAILLVIPAAFRTYLTSLFRQFSRWLSSNLTVVIEEHDGLTYNHRFAAANTYLGAKLSPLVRRIKVNQPVKEVNRDVITVDKDEEIADSFGGVLFTWLLKSKTVSSVDSSGRSSSSEDRRFELTFNKKYKDTVLKAYLPYITEISNQIKAESKVLKLYTYDQHNYSGQSWRSVTLTHPASFDTIAMEPEAKAELIEDLDNFKSRKDYYQKVGKAWKRGYLLYGPPGTGKSNLVAAMAKHLKYHLYDLDLKSLRGNGDLLKLLVRLENKSILVIEDIDRSGLKFMDATKDSDKYSSYSYREEITMSGLLNVIDGLWTSCGEERIIVFTTNNKETLDPALLRPGRMDVHIEMSYCRFGSFKTLARNYLDLEDHQLFGEIEALLSEVEVSPADVAGQLMRSKNADTALEILVKFLNSKKKKTPESQKKEDDKTPESQIAAEEPKKQEDKINLRNHKVKVRVKNLKNRKTRKLPSYKLEILVKHL